MCRSRFSDLMASFPNERSWPHLPSGPLFTTPENPRPVRQCRRVCTICTCVSAPGSLLHWEQGFLYPTLHFPGEYIQIYVHIFINAHIHIDTRMHVYTYIHPHTYIYVHMYIYTIYVNRLTYFCVCDAETMCLFQI